MVGLEGVHRGPERKPIPLHPSQHLPNNPGCGRWSPDALAIRKPRYMIRVAEPPARLERGIKPDAGQVKHLPLRRQILVSPPGFVAGCVGDANNDHTDTISIVMGERV